MLRKSLLLSTAYVLLAISSKAQPLQQLDSNNGFGRITFDQSLKQLKKTVSLKKVKSNSKTHEETYMISKLSDFSVYTFPVQSIYLAFYNEQLYQIEVKMQDQYDMMRNAGIRMEILRKVRSTYGNPTAMDTSFNTKTIRKCIYNIWQGDKVTLYQAWPWDSGASVMTNDINHPMIFIADTWTFVNNQVALVRQRELETGL